MCVLNDEDKFINEYFLDYVLNINDNYKRNPNLNNYHISNLGIEFIVRPECNQNCQYCYIAMHGKELYPLEERVPNNILINNLNIFLNYLNQKKIIPRSIDLFAGDLFYDNLFFDLIEIIYNFYLNIYQQEIFFFKSLNYGDISVNIPCNFSFATDENKVKKIIDWQNKFEEINIFLLFSASVDGKYNSFVRENKNDKEVDEYYDKIFTVAKQLKAGFHPMISPEGIKNAVINYDWWMNKIKEYDFQSLCGNGDYTPYFLEVRNYYWTKENIQDYLKLLDHMVDDRLKMCDNSIEKLAYHLFVGDGRYNTLRKNRNNDLIRFTCMEINNIGVYNDNPTCGLGDQIAISLNNMKISPCHRLTYKHLVGGQFKINEKNEITHIEAINPTGFIALHTLNYHITGKCSKCIIQPFCTKGCYGSQFEVSGEPCMQIENVCSLYIEKIKFLLNKYNDLGLLYLLFEREYNTEVFRKNIKALCDYFDIQIKELL